MRLISWRNEKLEIFRKWHVCCSGFFFFFLSHPQSNVNGINVLTDYQDHFYFYVVQQFHPPPSRGSSAQTPWRSCMAVNISRLNYFIRNADIPRITRLSWFSPQLLIFRVFSCGVELREEPMFSKALTSSLLLDKSKTSRHGNSKSASAEKKKIHHFRTENMSTPACKDHPSQVPEGAGWFSPSATLSVSESRQSSRWSSLRELMKWSCSVRKWRFPPPIPVFQDKSSISNKGTQFSLSPETTFLINVT